MDLKVLQAKHPEVKAMESAWKRAMILVDEIESKYTDREYFVSLPNESETEKERRKSAYLMGFYNPSQELVSTKGEYILRSKIDRNSNIAQLMAFVSRADKSGQSMNDFIKNQASPNLQAYGTVFAVIDKPRNSSVTLAEEIKTGMPYLCILNPLQIRNWSYSDSGELEWFRYIKGASNNSSDPFVDNSSDDLEYVTWTSTEYYRHDKGGKLIETFTHGFGIVPIAIQASFVIDSERTLGKTTFFSSSRHIFMGNTVLSKANTEILKYGSILAVHVNDWDDHKRIHLKDPDSNLPMITQEESRGNNILALNDMADLPKYIEKNIDVIDKANAQARYYFGLAMDTESSGQEAMTLSGPTGNPQSGVSKAYDFQDMDACLFSHAQDLQALETQIVHIASMILKVNNDMVIKYPTSFDVRGFADKVAQIKGLKEIGFNSDTGIKIAMKNLASDISPDDAEQAIITGEIEANPVSVPVDVDTQSQNNFQ